MLNFLEENISGRKNFIPNFLFILSCRITSWTVSHRNFVGVCHAQWKIIDTLSCYKRIMQQILRVIFVVQSSRHAENSATERNVQRPQWRLNLQNFRGRMYLCSASFKTMWKHLWKERTRHWKCRTLSNDFSRIPLRFFLAKL